MEGHLAGAGQDAGVVGARDGRVGFFGGEVGFAGSGAAAVEEEGVGGVAGKGAVLVRVAEGGAVGGGERAHVVGVGLGDEGVEDGGVGLVKPGQGPGWWWWCVVMFAGWGGAVLIGRDIDVVVLQGGKAELDCFVKLLRGC